MTDIVNEIKTARQAWNEMYFLGSFVPNITRMKVLSAGMNGMSQNISVILSLHALDIFGFDGFLLFVHQENDCQSNRYLGSSDRDDEKNDDLSI